MVFVEAIVQHKVNTQLMVSNGITCVTLLRSYVTMSQDVSTSRYDVFELR